MASDCLFLNQTDGNYGEFVLSDPAQRSRLLRNTDGTVATLDRDIAKSIRRLAIDEAATSLTIQVGNAQVAVATKSAAEVGRMGLQGGNSINANGITSTNNYHLLTFAAPHGLEVGDIALLKDNNNIQKLPVIYKENTKIGVYSTTAPAANATLYTDLCVLRIKFTASPGARKDRLGLSACVLNGTNLDARMFHDRSRISLITNGAAFTMRANDAAWRKGTNSRHAERVFMLDWQADDLHAIATVTTGAATHTVEMANQFVVGDLVQLAKTGQTSVEARISAATAATFTVDLPTNFQSGSVTISIKGVAYQVSSRLMVMRITAKPTAGAATHISKVYTPDTGVLVCTELFELNSVVVTCKCTHGHTVYVGSMERFQSGFPVPRDRLARKALRMRLTRHMRLLDPPTS